MSAQPYVEQRCEHCQRRIHLHGARLCVPCSTLLSDASPDRGEGHREEREEHGATANKVRRCPSSPAVPQDKDQDQTRTRTRRGHSRSRGPWCSAWW